MDSAGIFVFDVNDFDEAYLGHYTWDLQRMAASLALLGFGYALSDETIEEMIVTYGRAYVEQVRAFATGDRDEEFRLTLETTDGLLREFLQVARGAHAARPARVDDDARGPRAALRGRARRPPPRGRRARGGARGLPDYLETIPETKRQQSVSYEVKDVVGRKGFGIGSAGLPAYNLLVEGRTQALDNDVVLSMKQGNVPGAEPRRRRRPAARVLRAPGPPHRGLPARAAGALRPLARLVRAATARARSSQELSPYENDLDWDTVSEPDEILPLLRYLGQATAKVHCVSDAASDQPLVDFEIEEALMEAIGDEDERFAADLAAFGAAYGELARDDHRRFVDAFRNGAIPGRRTRSLRMRAASTAAFLALSTPTHATGTPGGICAIESRASSPPATDIDEVSGTPMTGSSVCAATTPGSAADRPAPAMITRRPRIFAFFA